MTMETVVERFKGHPCNFANLLGQVLDQDPDGILKSWGLPLPGHRCPICKKRIDKDRSFCSRECRKEFRTVTLICATCGKKFKRGQGEFLAAAAGKGRFRNGKPQERVYCSRHCYGIIFAKEHGFEAHPEHSINPPRLDYTRILELRREGWTAKRIAVHLGYRPQSVHHVIRREQNPDRSGLGNYDGLDAPPIPADERFRPV